MKIILIAAVVLFAVVFAAIALVMYCSCIVSGKISKQERHNYEREQIERAKINATYK